MSDGVRGVGFDVFEALAETGVAFARHDGVLDVVRETVLRRLGRYAARTFVVVLAADVDFVQRVLVFGRCSFFSGYYAPSVVPAFRLFSVFCRSANLVA